MTRAEERTSLAGRSLSGSRFFAVVGITIRNASTNSLAFSFANFRALVSGLEIVAAPETSALDDACPASGFLSAGSTTSCSVAFEVTDAPAEVVFASVFEGTNEPLRLEATVPTIVRCERCGGSSCVDFQTSDDHCGQCDRAVASCMNGRAYCPSEHELPCDGACVPVYVTNLDCSDVLPLRRTERNETCDAVCASRSEQCLNALAFYGDEGGGRQSLASCSDLPNPLVEGEPFFWLQCFCTR